jgi:preprotein translocase subunit SecG
MSLFFTILQVLAGLAVTAIVLMQSGKSAGLSGTISGGAETFMSKGKAKSWDAKLAKMTKWFALGFVVLTLVLNLMAKSGVGAEEVAAEDPAAATETVDDAEGQDQAETEPAA